MTVTALDPTSRPRAAGERRLAPRPATLRGQVLGVICNGLGNSELLFDSLIEQLMAMGELDDVVKVVKDSKSVPPTEEQWKRLEAATVVVAGFGGCGSCSARSMRDALETEWKGVPAVYVGHYALEPSAGAISKLSGHPGYPQVLAGLQPPVAAWADADARALGVELAPRVYRGLLDGAAVEADALSLVGS